MLGCGETYEEATADHDSNLRNLLQRCRDKGVKINKERIQLKLTQVAYMGNILTAGGFQPDPSKVKAIEEMPTLKVLTNWIQRGWPEARNQVPPDGGEYFPFREELKFQDGVIFKGERVVVPFGMGDEVVKKLHTSHLGVQACLRRAREAFCWPKINSDIEQFIAECSVCNTYRPQQQKDPMIAHPVPSRPWKSIASDLFEFEGRDYLITTDRYSNFLEVDRLYCKTSKEVFHRLKHTWPATAFLTNCRLTMAPSTALVNSEVCRTL